VLGGGDHPLLVRREVQRRCLVVFTSDRGFAGALNTNVIRATIHEIEEHGGETVTLVVIGRKGRTLIRRGHYEMAASFLAYGDRPAFADVLPLARLVTDDYLAGTYDAVDLVYSQFVSTLTQRPVVKPLLPIELPEEQPEIPGRQFIFEPSAGAVLEQILPRYVATRLYQAVLENTASFYSSQMVAMKNATENAEELISDYTLAYNKLRQANITREMIEIASGAEAL
jgi:F-type H+-transporting ATPase subunit gamma